MNWFGRPPCLLNTVIVNLTDSPDVAIRGVLWQQRGPWFVLKDAELLRAGQAPAPMDGEVVILRDRVLFFQVP